jgi:hypothetical protein
MRRLRARRHILEDEFENGVPVAAAPPLLLLLDGDVCWPSCEVTSCNKNGYSSSVAFTWLN